jgi:hypothetical protein
VLVLKLFYEEPASLEALSADADPDARRRAPALGALNALWGQRAYYRAYLAGTDLAADRVGATTLRNPEAFALPLAEVLRQSVWEVRGEAVRSLTVEDVPRRLLEPAGAQALAAGPDRPEASALRAVATSDRRYAAAELRGLLDAGFTVLFPEPAHHGHDWSLFAPEPLRDRLAEAFGRHPVPGLRRFAAPVRQARGEHRFYFERWALGALPDWVEELHPAEPALP